MREISYEGIDEVDLLVALYHGTRPLGLGRLHNIERFGREHAQQFLDQWDGESSVHMDYVAGRPIKLRLDRTTKTIHRVRLYDRDAGEGACQRVVDSLR